MRNNKTAVLIILIVSLTSAFASNGNQNDMDSTIVEKDVMLLASLINSEAGKDNYLKQVAVGAVVINRVEDPEFPDTLAGVIYQPGAFDSIEKGKTKNIPPDSCIEAARDALNGWDPVNGALHYWRGAASADKLATTVIGDYTFGFKIERDME